MNKDKSSSGDLVQLAPIKKRTKRKSLKKSKSTPALATVHELISRTISSTSLLSPAASVPETIYEPEHRLVKKLNSQRGEFQFPDDEVSSLGSPKGKSKTSARFDKQHLDSISINSPTSFRSYSSNLTFDSDYSHQSKLTNREMIHDISFRAKQNLAPPDYVPSFEELDPVHLSWDRKLPKHRKAKSLSSRVDINSSDEEGEPFVPSHPPINILPCMHPIELILACADSRTRRREKAAKVKQKKCEEKVEQLNQAIELKYTRAERYAAALELKQRQIAWIKIIAVNLYMQAMKLKYIDMHREHGQFLRISKAAMVLQRSMKEHMRRKLIGVKHFKFMQLLRSSRMRFYLHMRILRKKLMTKRIVTFLTEFKNNHQIPRVVKKYMAGVRKIQRNMRDFLTCKRAKVEVMGKIWERMEVRYIKKMLEERRAQKRGLSEKISKFNAQEAKEESEEANTHASTKRDEYQSKAKNEIKNQTKYWNKIDSMMENKIVALKVTGVLAEENIEEAVQKCQLSPFVRNAIMKNMLEKLRKEFYSNQKLALKKQIDADSVFKENHALDLLRGDVADLNRIINDKFNKKLVKLHYKPFLLFLSISNKAVYEKVREAHKVNETFKIRIEQAKKASVALTVTASNPASKVAAVVAAREAEAARVKLAKLTAL